jgi:hypothetical protein
VRYPFNKYGWTNLIWWFKYRLQKKYKYHKVYLNLKPGFYEYQDIIEKVIASPRFFWLFEYQYKEYKKLKAEQDPKEPIYTNEFDIVIKELKKAYLWFKKYNPRIDKAIHIQEEIMESERPEKKIETLVTINAPKAFEKYRKLTTFKYETTTHYLGIIVKHRMFLDT